MSGPAASSSVSLVPMPTPTRAASRFLHSAADAPADPRRRRAALALPLALALGGSGLAGHAAAKAADAAAAETGLGAPRLALLIGNRIYPNPFDLPPVHKNVRDMQAALEARGFTVTATIDQDPIGLKRTIDEFARSAHAAAPNATVMFYFTGHGMQVDAENLLLGAGIAPDAREPVLLASSLHLQRDVMELLPRRSTGLTIAVVDACRTSLRAAMNASDGLNQVEAPPGCLIVFSTAAGRPAIAPAVETLNTFYTGSLVKLLKTAADELSFSDFFRLVKLDVQQTMSTHPIEAIRNLAQNPFIAENTQVQFRLTPHAPSATPEQIAAEQAALWQQLQDSQWPAEVLKLAEQYLERFGDSKLAGSAEVARAGAGEAVRALRSNQVRLYRSAFQPKDADEQLLAEVRKAARGDKDAAARIARRYQEGTAMADPNRYEGWLQYAAALGNGIASYELALHYRRQGQPAPAAQYESRARELAYTPPPTLDHSRK